MTVSERRKQLRIVAEILQVHLPAFLEDQELARDLLSVAGVTLRGVYEDVLRSADAWDRKHYHLRADSLREEWTWALAAANTAEGLAYRLEPVTAENLERLCRLIGVPLAAPAQRVIRNPEAFRGAAAANRERQRRERSRASRRLRV
ncbi:MAG: hypothetical protein JW900_13915 [Anaerolineae bacterium]|nr:hypothetical protein [Anaerolineae bacterium]